MKKGLIILVAIILLIAGVAWYFLSGAGEFIRTQIEQQGSKYLDTSVSVFSVDLALSEGRMSINDLDIDNPAGFSDEDAFSVDAITFDLGSVIREPYVVQEVSINSPEILYEVDAAGQGNLLVLKNNLAANLPASNKQSQPGETANPLLIIENVSVKNVLLKLNFENFSTGDIKLEKKSYEITLPTFNAGPIGKPAGIPADQAGAAIVNAMLDNVIAQAKSEAKKKLAAEAKKLANEKIDEKKDELVDKAKDKLKDIFNKD